MNPTDTRPPAREREFGYAFVDVVGTDVTGLTIALSKSLKVEGRVSFDGPSPPASKGVRMRVHAGVLGPALLQMIGRPQSAAVDEKLRFELTEIQRGLPLVIEMSGLPGRMAASVGSSWRTRHHCRADRFRQRP